MLIAARYLNRLRIPAYRLIEVWGQAGFWPPDDADLANALEQWVPDPAQRRRVLVDNPERLYGFAPLGKDPS